MKIKIYKLEKQIEDLLYENNQLKSDLEYSKINGGIKKLTLNN